MLMMITYFKKAYITIKENAETLIVASKVTGLKEKMLIKLSTWSCLEIRMQDKVNI